MIGNMEYPTNIKFKIISLEPEFIIKLTSQEGEEFKLTTHRLPHFDEWLSFWIIWKFGDDKFLKEYGSEFKIGMGGGIFDEHCLKSNGKKICAAELVADKLEVRQHPYLQRILKGAAEADSTGAYRFLNLSDIIITMNQLAMGNSSIEKGIMERILYFVFDSLDAAFLKAKGVADIKKSFLNKEFKEVSWNKDGYNRVLKIIIAETDSPFVIDAMNILTKSQKIDWAVLIVKRSQGNLAIFMNKNDKRIQIDASKFFKILLEKESDSWYSFAEHAILNGNERYQKPPTNLKIDEIIALIKDNVDVD